MTEENKQILSKTKGDKVTETNESNIITTQKKEKNPKKVEAGKRLAQISREAKERKKRALLEASKEENLKETSSFIPTSTIIVSILSLGVISYFIYFKKQKESATQAQSALESKKNLEEKQEAINEKTKGNYVATSKKSASHLDNFD